MKRSGALFVLFLAAWPALGAGFRPAVVYRYLEHRPDSIAVADFNGDGRDDVAATHAFCSTPTCNLLIFLQTSSGTFDRPRTYPYSGGTRVSAIQAGDFNGDGRIDVAVASGGVLVFLQQANGSFAAPQVLDTPRGAYDIDSADVNGDGRLDLAAMPWGSQTMYVFEQQAAGGFAPRKDYAIDGNGYDDFDLADLNGDGRADAMNASGQGVSGRVYLAYAKPAGGFGDVIAVDLPWKGTLGHVETGDFNGDARVDLAVISYGGTGSPYLGLVLQKPDGTFEAGRVLPVLPWPKTLLADDFDGDGDTDLAVGGGQDLTRAHDYNVIQAWFQVAPGVFSRRLYTQPEVASNFSAHDHLAIGDADGDGIRDLIVGLDNGALMVFAGTRDRKRRAAGE